MNKSLLHNIYFIYNSVKKYLHDGNIIVDQNFNRLKQLKNKYLGERCFVVGNGPSLKNTDLSLLNNEYSIGSNRIYLFEESTGFIPTYFTIEDRLVAEDNSSEINNYDKTIKIIPHDLKYCLKSNNSIYINFKRYYSRNLTSLVSKFSTDFYDHCYWGGTVTYLNLQLAYYLGFKEVYLIGLDMNYKVPDYGIGKNVITSKEDDMNHFHKDYFGKGKRYHQPHVQRMINSLRIAKKYFENDNRTIYNATIGGQLEVFERFDYFRLFNK